MPGHLLLNLPHRDSNTSRSGLSGFSLLDEVIAVELLDDVRLGGAAADVVEDHQPGERAAVDEHDLRIDLAGVVDRLAGERACRHEHPLPGPSAVEGSDKLVDVGATDRAGPALRLEVDRLEAEPILVDQAVDPLVGPGTGKPAGGFAPSAVAHRLHQIEDDLLEERRRTVSDLVEDLGGELVIECPVSLFENGVGRLGDGDRLRGGLVRAPVVSASLLPEGPVRLELAEVLEVDGGGVLGQCLAAGVGDGEHAAPDTRQESGPLQMDLGPTEPIDEPGLRVARQQFRPFGIGETEVIGDRSAQGGEGPVLAVGGAPQEGDEDFVEGGNGHTTVVQAASLKIYAEGKRYQEGAAGP